MSMMATLCVFTSLLLVCDVSCFSFMLLSVVGLVFLQASSFFSCFLNTAKVYFFILKWKADPCVKIERVKVVFIKANDLSPVLRVHAGKGEDLDFHMPIDRQTVRRADRYTHK